MTARTGFQNRFHTWLSGTPDDDVLRWIFRTVVLGTAVALAADLASTNGWLNDLDSAFTPAESSPATPDDGTTRSLPGFLPSILAPLFPDGDRRVTPMPQPDGRMAKPMTFELVGGGKLMATGTITPGISQSFAAELNKRSDYVKTVVLNSPGGSVEDAMAMGKLIRERKLSTEVEAGKYCASSCPLMFFGGVERRAGEKAAIGVHQVFAMPGDTSAQRDGMSDAQRISARCQRYLGEMGINLQAWVHAMETPKDKLFIFKPDELKSLNIVTASNAPAAAASTSPEGRGRR